jgi:hypothetical protein
VEFVLIRFELSAEANDCGASVKETRRTPRVEHQTNVKTATSCNLELLKVDMQEISPTALSLSQSHANRKGRDPINKSRLGSF